MTYGTKVYKNGSIVGYLKFNTGKTVFLNQKENIEFDLRLRDIEYNAKLKAERKK